MITPPTLTSKESELFIQQFNTLTEHHDVSKISPGRFINLVLLPEDELQPGQAPARKAINLRKRDHIHTKEQLISIYERITAWVDSTIPRLAQEDHYRLHAPLCRLLYAASCLETPLMDRVSKLYATLFPKNVPLHEAAHPLFVHPPSALVNKPVEGDFYPHLRQSGLHQKFFKNETVAVWQPAHRQYRYAVVAGNDEERPRFVALYKDEGNVHTISDAPLLVFIGRTSEKKPLFQGHYCDSRATIGRISGTDYLRYSQKQRIEDLEEAFDQLCGLLPSTSAGPSGDMELKSLA